MPIRKPSAIAGDPFKSAKWDGVTAGRTFTTSHIPALTLLIQWYAVVERCIEDMDEAAGRRCGRFQAVFAHAASPPRCPLPTPAA